MSYEDDEQRYLAAAHAVQAGIGMLVTLTPRLFEPKHVRTGIDTAKVEHGALAMLLIDKGLFTKEEYMAALATAMEEEKAHLEDELAQHLGPDVTLV